MKSTKKPLVNQETEKDTVEEAEKSSEKNIDEIFQLLKDQPNISAKEIALFIGISQRAVEKTYLN